MVTATADSIRGELLAFADIADGATVLLVISAAHMMPRVVRMTRAVGLDRCPAPTDFLTPFRDARVMLRWLPHSRELIKSERAVYEYLAHLFFNPS